MIRIKLDHIVRNAVEQATRVGVPRAFKYTSLPKAVEKHMEQIVDQVVNEFYIALEEHGVELGDIEVGEGPTLYVGRTDSADSEVR